MYHRLFVANRGEVAARIARACDSIGIEPVFAVSEADRGAPWVRDREAICLGPSRSSQSYLDPVKVVQAAKLSGCTALHPGWGFLAENAAFASLVEAHGITFIGPPPAVMHRMGKKTPAKAAMIAAGLRVIPGSEGVLEGVDQARRIAAEVGYPVLLKAESGGGGRGMRIARSEAELAIAYQDASAEAEAAFGDERLYLEKLIERGRHVEIQLMADRYGGVIHLGERDCSVQRNHQKLIEESPAAILDADERARTLEAAVRATRAIGYLGAGTMEFLLDAEGVLRFMEMNTRLQVEHCVSEMRSGVDLVVQQIRVAAGHPLSLAQPEVSLDGHVIECRINAEDPEAGFRPTPGKLEGWELPRTEPGRLRIDTHVEQGYEVPPHYDSLICKVICRGDDRLEAIEAMIRALEGLRCEGVSTTIPMHLAILRSEAFRSNSYDTGAIPGWPPPAQE